MPAKEGTAFWYDCRLIQFTAVLLRVTLRRAPAGRDYQQHTVIVVLALAGGIGACPLSLFAWRWLQDCWRAQGWEW
jgi:EamA domain-containing membrane protein RarD